MGQESFTGVISLAAYIFLQLAFIVRVLLRPHREPTSRIAWIVVIVTLPLFGVLSYLLLGETNIGRHRVARIREVISKLPDVSDSAGAYGASLQA